MGPCRPVIGAERNRALLPSWRARWPQSTSLVPILFAPAWAHLASGINFSNISSEDLAFVYENTLVTEVARKRLGTHSTPSQLAEYIVRRLELDRYPIDPLRIYEPFVGAGVFLVSVLRHLRDLLPPDWSDERRAHIPRRAPRRR